MVVVVDLGQTRIWMLANLDIPSKNTKLVRVNANWLCLKTLWDLYFLWVFYPKSSIFSSKKLIIWKFFHCVQVISQLSSIQIDMRYHRLRKKIFGEWKDYNLPLSQSPNPSNFSTRSSPLTINFTIKIKIINQQINANFRIMPQNNYW